LLVYILHKKCCLRLFDKVKNKAESFYSRNVLEDVLGECCYMSGMDESDTEKIDIESLVYSINLFIILSLDKAIQL